LEQSPRSFGETLELTLTGKNKKGEWVDLITIKYGIEMTHQDFMPDPSNPREPTVNKPAKIQPSGFQKYLINGANMRQLSVYVASSIYLIILKNT
jgi:hypothetical protein